MCARAKGCVVEKSESMRTMRSVYDIAQLINYKMYIKKRKKTKKIKKKNVLTCIIVKFEKTRKMASIIVSASNDRIGESRWLVFHIDQRSVMRNTEAVILDTHGRLWKIDG